MAYLSLIAGLLLLVFSGDGLVKGSVQLSRHFKLSTLVVGLTVVGCGTSAAELFVSVKAAYNGVPDLGIGNVVGSNIANIGLILGLVAIFMPISIVNRSILRDWIVMMVASLMLVYAVLNGNIGFFEGLIFVSFLVLYIGGSIYNSKRKKKLQKSFLSPTMVIWKALLYVVVAIVGLYFGADLLVAGAREIAVTWGVSDRVIGVSLVAFGTSVPELVTSMVAMFRKENDISVGNIIGSNIFNIWAVLGATSLITPLPINDLNNVVFDIVISLAFAVLLLVFMIPLRKGVISRWKGGVLFALYIVYIFFIFQIK